MWEFTKPSVTPVPEYPMVFSGFCRHQHLWDINTQSGKIPVQIEKRGEENIKTYYNRFITTMKINDISSHENT